VGAVDSGSNRHTRSGVARLLFTVRCSFSEFELHGKKKLFSPPILFKYYVFQVAVFFRTFGVPEKRTHPKDRCFYFFLFFIFVVAFLWKRSQRSVIEKRVERPKYDYTRNNTIAVRLEPTSTARASRHCLFSLFQKRVHGALRRDIPDERVRC